jgi:hypothetical protein
MFTVTFNSVDEVSMTAYALKEHAGKLAEKAIDWKQPALKEESDKAYDLAKRIYQSVYKTIP